MRPIARTIRRWRAEHGGDGPLALVMTYPYYLHLADLVWPDRLVYFNIDDYRLYWPKVADEVTRLEHRAVRESDLTVCTSLHRAEELRRAVPEAAVRIRHLPHGAPSASIPDRPQHLPAPAAGRHRPPASPLDRLCRDAGRSGRLVAHDPNCQNEPNGLDRPGRAGRPRRRRPLASRPASAAWPCPTSTRSAGGAKSTIDAYNRSFDLGLIPYRVDHPFNVACCPTKIMDYMAAGRPVVSTDLPECRLHAHLFDVVEPDDFVEAVAARLAERPR